MTSRFAEYDHWRIRQDDENIVWLDCDRQGESSNSLSADVIRELDEILSVIEALSPVGLVIGSAKPDSFILGADIREFDSYRSADAVTDVIRQGHAVFSRLENLPCHTVAAIHGFALGGGLELALCCDYILALNVDDTRLGFPEIKLGIFPGLGGSVRITERLGGLAGMQLMLTTRNVRAPAARGMGLVDELVDESSTLHWASRRAIVQKRRRRKPSLLARASNHQPLRWPLARMLRYKTAEKVRADHYPAPFRLIDLWSEHRDHRRRMFEGEARGVGELMVGETAANLRRLFFLSERMKGLGKSEDFTVRRVHVIGAGVMGGDIAAWCVLQGMEVTLQDRQMRHIEPALKRATALFRRRLRKSPAVEAARSRLRPDVSGEGVEQADVVIEAIFEDADAKRALYAEVEPRLRDGAVLATNTSALPLEDLARDLSQPERLIGLHFFNPVAKMPLVEVIHGRHTAQVWVGRGCAFCSQISRFPLPTKSAPGFLVNRVLAPYLMAAFTLMLEGVDRHTIDAAAIRFGMPMGPIELADVVGLDVCMKVAETLARGDVAAHRAMLQRKLDAGQLGKKSGRGFHRWRRGRCQRRKVNVDSPYGDQLAARLMTPFLDECRAVSEEGIVADDDLLDAGIVFGTGFAPFRGGPMHYLKQQEADFR